MMRKIDSDIFYVGIKDPLKLRRSILETSKALIKSLQSYEKISRLRSKRAEITKEYKDIMSELIGYISSLKRELPRNDIFNKHEQHILKPKQSHTMSKAETRKERKELSNIDKLEQELAEVEEKLKMLG